LSELHALIFFFSIDHAVELELRRIKKWVDTLTKYQRIKKKTSTHQVFVKLYSHL